MFQLYRNFATQAQIDAEYDVGAMVTGAAAYRARYSDKSDQARRELDCVLDVAFGPTLDETLDIFPAAQRGAPVFVFMHGGYWRAFSSKDFSFVALGLQRLGITTVVVNYALAPKVSLDEITRQACASIAWVIRNIGQHGGDPQRIVVGGHSAGAHLSAMCMRAEWQREYGLTAAAIVGAVLVSGIYDLTPLRYSYLQPMIQLDDGVIRRNSPLFLMRQSRARSLVCWGSEESGESNGNRAHFMTHCAPAAIIPN